MDDAIRKLNGLLGQNEPTQASKLNVLLGHAYMQSKEEDAKRLVPALRAGIDALNNFSQSDDTRMEIVYGFFTHPQILRTQIEAVGIGIGHPYKMLNYEMIKLLLSNNKKIYDGRAPNDTQDGHFTKQQILANIKANKRQATAPVVSPVIPPQAEPTPIGSFTVAIPIDGTAPQPAPAHKDYVEEAYRKLMLQYITKERKPGYNRFDRGSRFETMVGKVFKEGVVRSMDVRESEKYSSSFHYSVEFDDGSFDNYFSEMFMFNPGELKAEVRMLKKRDGVQLNEPSAPQQEPVQRDYTAEPSATLLLTRNYTDEALTNLRSKYRTKERKPGYNRFNIGSRFETFIGGKLRQGVVNSIKNDEREQKYSDSFNYVVKFDDYSYETNLNEEWMYQPGEFENYIRVLKQRWSSLNEQ